MIILGFDYSSAVTGWAIVEHGPKTTLVSCGRILLPTRDPIGSRLKKLREALHQQFKDERPDEVFYEETYVRFVKAAGPLFKVGGIVDLATMELWGLQAKVISVSTIRCNLGCRTKQGVKQFVSDTFKIAIQDDQLDISDAIAVALAAGRHT